MVSIKFAHMADCHLGSWKNHPELEDVPTKVFEKAMNICIDENVDFILLSGDLFHSSLPSIDTLSKTVSILKKVNESGIRVYVVAGSHDFSPSGKTMLTVLEKAGLFTSIAVNDNDVSNGLKIIKDKSGAIITGMFGKKGALEHEYFQRIRTPSLKSSDFKIFMLHSAITEYKPEHLKEMSSISLSDLPKGFNYYASGHVHQRTWKNEAGIGTIAFPGPLFPANFQELEKTSYGGFFLVNVSDNVVDVQPRDMKEYDVVLIDVKADGKSSEQLEREIIEDIEKHDIKNKIVLVKASGTLKSGRSSDISFRSITEKCKDALTVKRNFNQLRAKEFEETDIESGVGIEKLESDLIKEHLGQIKLWNLDKKKEEDLTHDIMNVLDEEKREGETNDQFRNRVVDNMMKILKLDEINRG